MQYPLDVSPFSNAIFTIQQERCWEQKSSWKLFLFLLFGCSGILYGDKIWHIMFFLRVLFLMFVITVTVRNLINYVT
jgi:hypothetical protein